MRTIHSLEFNEGFYRDENKSQIGNHAGLYFVYRGVRNKKPDGKYSAVLYELLYVGQAEDVNARINGDHIHYDDWCEKLENGEIIYYSTCSVNLVDLDKIEAACIYRLQPPINTQCKESYSYNPVRINCKGKKGSKLPESFDVG
jgi:hypothetical protein